jgi:hypothetical protein
MSVACVSCKEFSMKRVQPEWAHRGFGHCAHRAPFIRHHATKDRDCDKHVPDAAEVVAARAEWIRRRGL